MLLATSTKYFLNLQMSQNQRQSDKFAFDRSENVDKSDSVGGNLFDAAPLNYTLCGSVVQGPFFGDLKF